ncbi:MAG: DUF1441 family protein [Candidatus Competibacteraceae bacterium]|nr:DUF1441 family protein [Candidatus Competibacteraceae bacterium]
MTESTFDAPLLWLATKYSDVLRIDPRVVKQALETVPYTIRGQRQLWHVRDAMPAIFQRVYGSSTPQDPDAMSPKDALDYYRAQRESLRLNEDIRKMIPAENFNLATQITREVIAETLKALPDALEKDCGLSPIARATAQRAVDAMIESFAANLCVNPH